VRHGLFVAGFVLVQGGVLADRNLRTRLAKSPSNPTPRNKQKPVPKEEEERAPKANTKAPPRVDDEEGDTPSGRRPVCSDLTQEARKATNPW